MIRAWWARRKRRKADERIREGFGYAMYAYLVDECPLGELEDHIDYARTFDDYSHFEQGIEVAISMIEKWESRGLMYVQRLRSVLYVG